MALHTRTAAPRGAPDRRAGELGAAPLDPTIASFVDGIGAAAATSGILSQQQGRIFALLYLQDRPLSLDEIAGELEQSKSNVSINIRGLVEWHLVRRRPVPGSRRDHYEAATDFFRAMQEILERRFRWTVRQVLTAVEETRQTASGGGRAGAAERERRALLGERLETLGRFFSLIDAGIGAFVRGEPFPAQKLAEIVPLRRAGTGSPRRGATPRPGGRGRD